MSSVAFLLRADPRRLGFAVAAGALVLDQLSKLALLFGFGFMDAGAGDIVQVTPFFNLVMVWNRGVSFGLFQADSLFGRLFLLIFSGLVVVALLLWLKRAQTALLGLGIGLVIGGALGNMVDRIAYGAVADFFHLHAFGYDWYVFNVADAAICIGVGVLMYESLFGRETVHKGVET